MAPKGGFDSKFFRFMRLVYPTPEEELEDKLGGGMIPEIGDIIYVPTSLYLGHGGDNFCGGMAHIVEIEKGRSGGKETYFVRVKERPSCLYNWEFLLPKQKELKERHGDTWAHPEPDYREEFNDDE